MRKSRSLRFQTVVGRQGHRTPRPLFIKIFNQLGNRTRAAEIKPLHIGDAVLKQPPDLLLGFHPFGNGA